MSSLRFNSIGYEPTMERWLPVVGYEGIYEVRAGLGNLYRTISGVSA
jgi:hypothetical protein